MAEENSAEENGKDKNFSKLYFGAFGFVALIWVIWALIALKWGVKSPNEFGDAFGGLSALFSGLAFAGLIITLRMQGKELQLQRKELELARGEYERIADETENQAKTIEKQSELLDLQVEQGRKRDFEEGFYRRLDSWNACAGRDPQSGFRIFNGYLQGIKFEPIRPTEDYDNIFEATISRYPSLRDDNDFLLAPYFTRLYQVMIFVQKNQDEAVRKEYFSILRSQFGNADKFLIALNISDKSGAGMKSMVEEYNLLKGMDPVLTKELEKAKNP